MEEMIAELGLQDCFEDISESDSSWEISLEKIQELDSRINDGVRENEIALNKSAELCAAFAQSW